MEKSEIRTARKVESNDHRLVKTKAVITYFLVDYRPTDRPVLGWH